MMKTKLTLFVTVLAAGLILVAGCGDSTEQPSSQKPKKPKNDLTNGLVAYYPFNGNAKDESGNGNGGGVKGASLIADRHGKKASAYGFDGKDDYIVVKDADSLRPDYITISVWFNSPEALLNFPLGAPLVTKSELTIGKRQPRYEQLTFGAQFHVKRESNGQSTLGWQNSGAAPSPSIGVWEHRVGLWDGKKVKLYVNGKLAASKEGLAGPMDNVSGGNLNFGVGWDLEGDYFQGDMDDIRIYNRALSEAEVKALYEFEKPKGK